MDNTNYGIDFKQILFEQAKIAPYRWLHKAFLNQFQALSTATQQNTLIDLLKKLLNLYDCFSDKEPSFDSNY